MTTPATVNQIPDHAILDHYNKQNYLGNRFVYSLDSQSIASTAETPLFLLTNPAVTTSAFPSTFKALCFDIKKVSCLTASQNAILKFYVTPTISANGTAKTPQNVRPASSTVSIAKLYQTPTIGANGTLVNELISSAFVPDSSDTLFILDPGQSLLINVKVSANPTVISVDLGWYEL